MKGICALILSVLLLSGCVPSAVEGSAVPAPEPVTEETPAPYISLPVHCSADEALADAPDMLPISTPSHFIPIETTLPANGDELFSNVFSTLSQTPWTSINEVLSTLGDIHLAEDVTIEDLDSELTSLVHINSSLIPISADIDEEMNLSYIRISSGSLNTLYLFFDIQGENHIPKFALLEHWRAEGYELRRIGDERFIVYDYADTWGTGILVEKLDWYNVDTMQVEMSFVHTAMIADRPWNPLGWWTFEGGLGEPQIEETSKGRYMLSFDSALSLYRYTNEGGKGVAFEKQPKLHLIYDTAEHRAYALGGTDRWCFGYDETTIPTELCCAYFKEELEELAAGGAEDENLWAQMLLLDDDWETVLERNGLTYDREAGTTVPADDLG